jgi:transposase
MSWRNGQAYAQDLRDRVLATPGVLRKVAERFGVSQAYVCRARARREKPGQSHPGAQCNHRPLRLATLETALREQVAKAPAHTLRELCQWVQTEHGIQVGITTMFKTLGRFGLTLKKITLHASEQTRPDVAQARQDWSARQPDLPAARLIFLDETWATTRMAPTPALPGLCPGGPLTHHHVCLRAQYPGSARAPRTRRPRQWACLSRLGGAVFGARAAPQRYRGDGQPQRP